MHDRRLIRILISCVLACLHCSCLSRAAEDELPLRFNLADRFLLSPDFGQWVMLIEDLDHDGTDEMIVILDPNTLQARSPGQGGWVTLWQTNLSGGSRFTAYSSVCTCGDLDGDGISEIAVSYAVGETLAISAVGEGYRRLLMSTPVQDTNDDGRLDAAARPVGTVPVPPTGETALLVARESRMDFAPRAVAAFSIETGQRLWNFSTGSNPYYNRFRYVNLDGSAGDEILFTMPAPCNGRSGTFTDDCHAWVVVLTSSGEPLWIHRLGEDFCRPVWAEPFWPDPSQPYVVTCARNQGTKDDSLGVGIPLDTLRVWQGPTGALTDAIELGSSLRSLCVLDETRFVIATTDSTLSIFDVSPYGNLELVRRQKHDHPVVLNATGDIDGDGRIEIVGYLKDWTSQLVVFDDQLRRIGQRDLGSPGSPIVELMRRAGRPPLLVVAIDLEHMTMEAVRTKTARTRYLLWVVLFGAALILVGGLGFSIAYRHRMRRHSTAGAPLDRPPVQAPVAGDTERLRELLMAVKLTRHGKLAARKVVHRIGWLVDAAVQEYSEATLHRLKSAARDYQDISVSQIDHVLALGTALRLDSGVTNGTAEVKQELARVIERLSAADWSRDAISQAQPDVKEAVRLLEAGLRQIESVTLTYLTVPLVSEIERATEAVRDSAAAIEARIDVRIDPEVQGCLVRAARGDLAIILENLLANAVRAVNDSKAREVSVTASLEGRVALVEITDTGCGIPPEEWETIFQAGASSKESEGGLGLFASRRLLEGLGGTLRVKSSQPGEGTTMELGLLIESGDQTGMGFENG